MSSHDCKRLLAFWRGGVYGTRDSDSVLQCECPDGHFLKGELRHAEQGPHIQQHCQEGERTGDAVCSNSEQLGRLIRKVQSEGISWPQPDTAGRMEAAQTGECGSLLLLGAGRVGDEHLRLFKARQSPLPWQRLNIHEGKVIPTPTPPSAGWGRSAKQAGQDPEPPAGCISSKERQQEECLKSPF